MNRTHYSLPPSLNFVALAILGILCILRSGVHLYSGAMNPDFYWHLAYGNSILENLALPAQDWLSWSAPGRGYVLTQWGGEAIQALAFQVAGFHGTATLSALLVTVSLYFSYRTIRLQVENPWVALALAIICNSLLGKAEFRPQLFGFALFSALVFAVERTRNEPHTTALLYQAPLILAAWVNLHGSYVMGLIYLVVVFVADVIGAYIARTSIKAPRFLRTLVIATVLSVLATLVNPYGWGAWRYVIDVLSLQSTHMGLIPEWTTPSFSSETGMYFVMLLAAVVFALAYSRLRPSFRDLAVTLAFLMLGYAASRNLFFTGLVVAPFIGRLLGESPLYDLVSPSLNRALSRRMLLALCLGALAVQQLLYTTTLEASERRVKAFFSAQAISKVQALGIDGVRVLNDINIGGYMPWYAPSLRSFMDGRLDLFGDDMYRSYLRMMRAEPGWRDDFSRWSPDVLLLGPDGAALMEAVRHDGTFCEVHRDRDRSVLVRTSSPASNGCLPVAPISPEH